MLNVEILLPERKARGAEARTVVRSQPLSTWQLRTTRPVARIFCILLIDLQLPGPHHGDEHLSSPYRKPEGQDRL